ncbi:hypothetical protein ARMSODRAFT_891861 [Armillaria solidipes]|uniref:Aspartic peptidase DDI1-type domain-containing protein n=1 Tax=Armillaria solidipes TaxID=1076256 RepID=A0A2H3BQT8_9AGAR|nr:hypothetical protein ARMSODRAFT_891861 [Armillaria solidipes]
MPDERPSTRYKLKIAAQLRDRPMYSAEDKICLATYIDVNGMSALALWDSGSTSTVMSPHFANVSKTLVFNLNEPVTLQLGMVGSRSKINFGTMANITIARLNPTEYIDVVNIDRYDMLIGTPFMHQYQVILDFEKKCVCMNSVDIPAEVVPTLGNSHDARRHRIR